MMPAPVVIEVGFCLLTLSPCFFFGDNVFCPPDLTASGSYQPHSNDKNTHHHHPPVVSAYWSRDEGISTLLRTLPSWDALTTKKHASSSGHRAAQLQRPRDSVHSKVRQISIGEMKFWSCDDVRNCRVNPFCLDGVLIIMDHLRAMLLVFRKRI